MGKISKGNFDVKVDISSKDELENLSNYFNQMVYSLKKANTQVNQIQQNIVHFDRLMTIGQLMASISHEIKNPLNSIMVTADILQMKCSDEEKKKQLGHYLEDIVSDTIKIRDIVDQTLSFSKSGELKIEDICADEFMENLEVYTKRIIFFNNEVGFNIQKLKEFCKYKLRFNRVSLEQIFVNILKNAVEAIPEGRKGFISINVEYEDNFMIFYVKDNGRGIPKEQLPYIFKDFYTTKTSGTGLGLAIVKNLLEEFGGNIKVESKENKGSTFIIKIPAKICRDNQDNI
jgi:signal transduction histidine kinase